MPVDEPAMLKKELVIVGVAGFLDLIESEAVGRIRLGTGISDDV